MEGAGAIESDETLSVSGAEKIEILLNRRRGNCKAKITKLQTFLKDKAPNARRLLIQSKLDNISEIFSNMESLEIEYYEILEEKKITKKFGKFIFDQMEEDLESIKVGLQTLLLKHDDISKNESICNTALSNNDNSKSSFVKLPDDKALEAESMASGRRLDESLPDDIISLWADCTKAYGTVAYLRVTSSNKEILTSFVASKNKIAPLTRLELMGALLSARLSSNILKALKLNIPCFFWTDSKITYFWVRGQPERFKPFIKNRIQEIQKLTSPSNWHHCPGIQNPADIVSRGVKISRLLNDTSWLQGPEWLRLPPEFWSESKNEDSPNSPDLEYRKSNDIVQHECIIYRKSLFDISQYSNLEKVLRITAEELSEAERFWIQVEQEKFFPGELKSLKDNKIEKESLLYNYMPYLDENGLIRLGGRLEFCNLSINEKHPLILPKNSWLTTLIVCREHNKVMHGGTASTLAQVRSNYWISKGRQLAN
ncbi:integrase catalytic domain-containing protein [Trichonephila inaurata madagascariensis]|uniref:Integrase catalytic domain-containing protein n=1 Tax=Trichonephila inaurata madagascariensis TaxID=2747483 RepID=A0A8X6M791_9ARAC|nr:integrase catalytic domain-containing protein [Trichonephila inaurata madagascariensis]